MVSECSSLSLVGSVSPFLGKTPAPPLCLLVYVYIVG